jgi:hypothetical protein
VLAARAGYAVTILDGTIIGTYRMRWASQHKQWYCARKKTYGSQLTGVDRRARQPTVDLDRAPG